MSVDPVAFMMGDPEGFENVLGKKFSEYIADPQGFNNYSYVKNNPLKYVDDQGLIPVETVLDIIAAALSAHTFNQDPTAGNLAFLALDGLGLAVPYIPSVFGYIRYSDKVWDLYKYFGKYSDDIVEVAKNFAKNVNFDFARRAWSGGEVGNDVASLVAHFAKHGELLHVDDVYEYYNRANNFIDNNQYTHHWVQNGKKYFYDYDNKIIEIVGKDGEIKSFFKVTSESSISRYDHATLNY